MTFTREMLTSSQRELLKLLHAQGATFTSRSGDGKNYVSGTSAAALVRKGLARYNGRFDTARYAVELTDEGHKLAESL